MASLLIESVSDSEAGNYVETLGATGGVSSTSSANVFTDSTTAFEFEFIDVIDTELFTDAVGESETGTQGLAYTVSDTETESDSLFAFAYEFTSLAETEIFTDVLNGISTAVTSVSDTESESDSLAGAEAQLGSISDTETTSDVLTAREAQLVLASDTESESDSLAVLESQLVAITDTETESDSLTATSSFLPSVSDTETFPEGSGAASPTLVQTSEGTNGAGGGTITFNLNQPTTAGNFILICLGDTGITGPYTVSDDIGNNYLTDTDDSGQSIELGIFRATNIIGGATTVFIDAQSGTGNLGVSVAFICGILRLGRWFIGSDFGRRTIQQLALSIRIGPLIPLRLHLRIC